MSPHLLIVLASLLHPLTKLLPSPLTLFGAVIYLALSLALIFVGKRIASFLAFLVAGLAVGAAGALLGTLFLPVIGTAIGFVLGFVVGGIIGLVLLRVGIGIAIGLFAYYATLSLTGSELLSVVAGVAFLVLGIFLSGRLLGIATALIGGILLYDIMVLYFHIEPILSAIVSLILAAAGAYVQWPRHHVHVYSGPVGMYSGQNRSGYSSSANPPRPYCAKCGSVAPLGAEFCANCGAKL